MFRPTTGAGSNAATGAVLYQLGLAPSQKYFKKHHVLEDRRTYQGVLVHTPEGNMPCGTSVWRAN